MKLAAIFNVWADSVELLPFAVDNIQACGVDHVIVVWSKSSNYGEVIEQYLNVVGVIKVQCEPIHGRPAMFNETRKRNAGLQKARELGCTHFLTADSDEFYEPEAFKRETERFHVNPNLAGLVCGCQTYFRSPKLTIGLDTTIVPFIHKLTPTISHGMNRNYPFAWDPGIRIDPTRQLNINSGVEWSPIVMHHYSWVRSNYGRKIRNSTARPNLERSTIFQDLLNAKDGEMCNFYRKPLVRAQVDFGIPEYELSDQDLQLMAAANKAP